MIVLALFLWQVLFDNGSENTVSEEDIYSINEQLPRRVKDRIKNVPVPLSDVTKQWLCAVLLILTINLLTQLFAVYRSYMQYLPTQILNTYDCIL